MYTITEKTEILGIILSGILCCSLFIPFIVYVIFPLIQPTPEQIEFCNNPNAICEPFMPVMILFLSIVGFAILFFKSVPTFTYIVQQCVKYFQLKNFPRDTINSAFDKEHEIKTFGNKRFCVCIGHLCNLDGISEKEYLKIKQGA